jgi:hypothetical protein
MPASIAFDDLDDEEVDSPRQQNIRLRVQLVGMLQKSEIAVPCGEGNQTIKWLALAVGQRISSQLPQGARRSYEHSVGGIRGGFVVPGEIVCNGVALDPSSTIKAVFEDGETCTYRPGASFSGNSVPNNKPHTCGLPSTYLSPFAQEAFYPNTKSSIKKSREMYQRPKMATPTSRYEERIQRNRVTEDDVLAARFRIVMTSQAEFSETYSGKAKQESQSENGAGAEGEGKELASLAVENMFDQLDIRDICPDKDLNECKEVT